jgi:hypothetical protein
MASYTPNFNLKKPADSDSYDIADHNGNMDKIDTALNTLNGKLTEDASWTKFSDAPLVNCQAYGDIGVKYAKHAGFVVVYIYVKSLTANTRTKISTLPDGYCPLGTFAYIGMGGESYTSKAYFTIAGNGEIYVLSEDAYAQGYIVFWNR